jgi:hypothetical protein
MAMGIMSPVLAQFVAERKPREALSTETAPREQCGSVRPMTATPRLDRRAWRALGAAAVPLFASSLSILWSCAAVYPEAQTQLRAPNPNSELLPPPPKGVYWIAFKEAEVPEKTRDGRTWHELGNKLPDPQVTLFVNGKELIKTAGQNSTLHPTWPGSPRGNFRLNPGDRLRVELWEESLVKKPICVKEIGNSAEDWAAAKEIRLECDGGARITVSFEPAHGRVGYGFYYELRTQSVFLTRVFEESAAARAGLKTGDEVVRFGDKRARDMKPVEVQSYVNAPKMEGIVLSVKHPDGNTVDVTLKEEAVYPLYSEIGALP